MKILSLCLLLLRLHSAQAQVTRVCGLRLVVDYLLWSSHRESVVRQHSELRDTEETARVTRYVKTVDSQMIIAVVF